MNVASSRYSTFTHCNVARHNTTMAWRFLSETKLLAAADGRQYQHSIDVGAGVHVFGLHAADASDASSATVVAPDASKQVKSLVEAGVLLLDSDVIVKLPELRPPSDAELEAACACLPHALVANAAQAAAVGKALCGMKVGRCARAAKTPIAAPRGRRAAAAPRKRARVAPSAAAAEEDDDDEEDDAEEEEEEEDEDDDNGDEDDEDDEDEADGDEDDEDDDADEERADEESVDADAHSCGSDSSHGAGSGDGDDSESDGDGARAKKGGGAAAKPATLKRQPRVAATSRKPK
jgi:hypothetical protein